MYYTAPKHAYIPIKRVHLYVQFEVWMVEKLYTARTKYIYIMILYTYIHTLRRIRNDSVVSHDGIAVRARIGSRLEKNLHARAVSNIPIILYPTLLWHYPSRYFAQLSEQQVFFLKSVFRCTPLLYTQNQYSIFLFATLIVHNHVK